jgi:hypothetical protein
MGIQNRDLALDDALVEQAPDASQTGGGRGVDDFG